MPALVDPDLPYQRSFLAAVDEIRTLGEDERHAGLTVIGATDDFAGEFFASETLGDPDTFSEFCRRLSGLSDPATWRPEGIVASTHVWWVDGVEYLGRLSIRHALTPWLEEYGGHVGYVVRPSARRKGHASAMLRAALPIANRLGIDPVLVTCDDSNAPSRTVIERAGGRFEDQRGNKLRYWISTTPSPAA